MYFLHKEKKIYVFPAELKKKLKGNKEKNCLK